ncbi:hypothetical protein GOODEAATRI_015927, partial [Goodea atripinnis]
APHDSHRALWFESCEDQITGPGEGKRVDKWQAEKGNSRADTLQFPAGLRTKVNEPVLMPRLSRVAVCGGTHGNELSGVYLVQKMLKTEKRKEDREMVSVQTVLSNPRAVQHGPISEGAPYEIIRSRELNAMLGPKGSRAAVDLVCDLHNTTANMGLCFIAYSDSDWICLHIFKYLQDRDFCLLHPGDSLFQTFSGETLTYKGNEPLYPFFINECAYYEKGIAVSLARKKCITIPSIWVTTEEEERVSEQSFASEEEE